MVPFFPTPWLVLPLETLQGLTFGMAYCTGTVNCKRIAPPHLRSTTQVGQPAAKECRIYMA